MKLKRLLWSLPVLAIVLGAIASHLFYQATGGLLSELGQVDSPRLSRAQTLVFELNALADGLKGAVAAADQAAVDHAGRHAEVFRENLRQLSAIPGQQDEARRIGQQFEAYHQAAMAVVGILIGGKPGDVGEAAQAMQAAHTTLADHLAAQQHAAQAALNSHIAEAHDIARRGFFANVAASLVTLVLSVTVSLSAVRGLLRQLGGSPQLATDIVHRIAAGDLSEPIALKPGSEGSLLHAMKSMQGQLSEVIGGVHHAVTEVSHAVDAMSQGNQALAERTMRQAASLQASASSVEEITASVRHNAESAEHARELAQQSSRQAESGSRAVADAVGTMSEVSQRARKIVEITALIDGIAFQTNILALNAAVEAARAGEQGRGFSVVAGEVRVLAQRAAAASREIKSLIEDSARHIETGAQHVNAAGAAMDELVASVRRVGEYIEHISTASQEQRQGIELVNHAVSELESDTQQNHVMVEEAGQAARALQDVARELGRAVGRFKLEPVVLPLPPTPAPVVDVTPRVPLLTA